MLFQTLWFPTKTDLYSRMSKSKMATKIQNGGRKFWALSNRCFSLANIYHHAIKLDLCPNVLLMPTLAAGLLKYAHGDSMFASVVDVLLYRVGKYVYFVILLRPALMLMWQSCECNRDIEVL